MFFFRVAPVNEDENHDKCPQSRAKVFVLENSSLTCDLFDVFICIIYKELDKQSVVVKEIS